MDTLQAEAVYETSQKPTAGCGKQPKLKPNQAKHLLELHDLGTYTQAELAELFGVGRSTIYRTLERMRPAPSESERPSHALRTLRLEKNNKSPSRDRAALRSGVLGVLIVGGSRTGGPSRLALDGPREQPEAFALQPLITAALWQDSPLRFDASDRRLRRTCRLWVMRAGSSSTWLVVVPQLFVI
jgi:Helix-turn-helix domain of resolvase